MIPLRITDINNLGFGVSRDADGKVVFVRDTADGDLCEVKIIKSARDYSVGRLVALLEPSPHRAEPHCQAHGCGGCAYGAVTYEHELWLKRRTVMAEFKKAGLSVEVGEVRPSPSYLGYRNKAQYPVARGADGVPVIGFYAPRSHRVVEAAHCPLTPPLFGRIAEEIRAHAVRAGVLPYDEEDGTGLLRHIYLRAAKDCREVLLTLVVTRGEYPEAEALCRTLTQKFPMLVGILLNVNDAPTNVILGKRYVTLWGRPYLCDTLADVTLELAPAAFYQVNRDAAEALYRHAAALAELRGDEVLLDLYCGAGSIGLSMAGRVSRLFGIEIVPEAVECARRNAAAAGIKNAVFAVGDAAATAEILASHGVSHPDVIVLDPPRAGADARLLDTVDALAPSRLVYISCNPATLARDVAYLTKRGFVPGPVTPFDLFPRTGHVESVVCLTRRLDNELRERMN
ncbi:MAG: 23S rRNA (uracil(1939)-C(5))-methyltransferase RlmD [Clostridia bacterium]|nr:23S rRNA (uracil(1939)-C(5))-methyltransferase RlmD [Clostridia bacterium]